MDEKKDALSRFREADRARGRAYRTRLVTGDSGFQELFSLDQVQARARKLSLPFGISVERPVERSEEEVPVEAPRLLESLSGKDQIVELILEMDGLLREPVERLFNTKSSG